MVGRVGMVKAILKMTQLIQKYVYNPTHPSQKQHRECGTDN